MAIKITKSGRKIFDAVCPQYGCEFTYEIEDVNFFMVICPECGRGIVHPVLNSAFQRGIVIIEGKTTPDSCQPVVCGNCKHSR